MKDGLCVRGEGVWPVVTLLSDVVNGHDDLCIQCQLPTEPTGQSCDCFKQHRHNNGCNGFNNV